MQLGREDIFKRTIGNSILQVNSNNGLDSILFHLMTILYPQLNGVYDIDEWLITWTVWQAVPAFACRGRGKPD